MVRERGENGPKPHAYHTTKSIIVIELPLEINGVLICPTKNLQLYQSSLKCFIHILEENEFMRPFTFTTLILCNK